MTIREVITQLQALLAVHGDLDVCLLNQETWTSAPLELLEYCRAGEGVTLVATWGPLDTVDQAAPERILLS